MTTTRSSTPTSIPDPVRVPIRDAIRSALFDLLTTDQHPAASPDTLTAVADTRQGLTARYTDPDNDSSVGPHTPAPHRHAALSRALGLIGGELLDAGPTGQPDPTVLHHGLTTLAAVALAWLDTLPTPDDSPPAPETLLADIDSVLGFEHHVHPQVLLRLLASYDHERYARWTLDDLTSTLAHYGITPVDIQGQLVIDVHDITQARTHHNHTDHDDDYDDEPPF
ncbi:MAG: hypothetical protein JO115_03850 [Pseudonocardiales bacterium]|nr:hypothetical protein [Pseudonocardiales bacterium]